MLRAAIPHEISIPARGRSDIHLVFIPRFQPTSHVLLGASSRPCEIPFCSQRRFVSPRSSVSSSSRSSGSGAWAGFFSFDPTGTASTPASTIAGIDIGPGNALAKNVFPLVVGSTFQLYYQGQVSGLIGTNGLPTSATGLGSSYQITSLASFTEVVTNYNATTGSLTFALAANQSSSSFFNLYYADLKTNPSQAANALAGTNFNAGTLILSASASASLPSVGVFSNNMVNGKATTATYDQYLTNHNPGVQAVVGSGSALLNANVSYENTAFFKTPLSQISFNSSLVSTFTQTDPSKGFTSSSKAGAVPDILPSIGTINGANGRDFQFQADANFSFTPAVVPEPSSLILSGMGLLAALSAGARSRSTRKSAI